MTSLTIQLPDELVAKAERAGLLNQQFLTETLSHFLTEKIKQQNKVKNWSEFFNILDQFDVPADFKIDREQPKLEKRPALDDLFAKTQS